MFSEPGNLLKVAIASRVGDRARVRTLSRTHRRRHRSFPTPADDRGDGRGTGLDSRRARPITLLLRHQRDLVAAALPLQIEAAFFLEG